MSVAIAVMASYAALNLAGRITWARGRARVVWFGGGAFAMWSMRDVRMLAFQLPVRVEQDWPTVWLSLLATILASAIALFVTSRKQMDLLRASIALVFMGSAIAGLHYIDMAALRLKANGRAGRGHEGVRAEARCLAAGMPAYVSKPINRTDLLAAMERILERAITVEPNGRARRKIEMQAVGRD